MKKWLLGLFATSKNAKRKQQNKEISSNNILEDQTIVDREPIDGTPFWIQRIHKKGWFITLKGYQLSPAFKTKEEAVKYIWLENHGWNVIANMIIVIHEQVANEAVKEYEKRENAKMAITKEGNITNE